MPKNLNKLNIKCQLYPKPTKIAFSYKKYAMSQPLCYYSSIGGYFNFVVMDCLNHNCQRFAREMKRFNIFFMCNVVGTY